MSRFTLVIAPGERRSTKKVSVSTKSLQILSVLLFLGAVATAYAITDYIQLRSLRSKYLLALEQNRTIKGEARILMSNLDEVKTSLGKVRDYTSKLGEITNLQASSVSKRTGIPALKLDVPNKTNDTVVTTSNPSSVVPSAIQFDSLVFKPVFQRLNAIGFTASNSVYDLQNLISSLSQQKSLLSSVPSMNPVDGWITSGFGSRKSPFTGEPSYHNGLDVAAPVGTPIHAPADGVVIFSGTKSGFGNFVMLAHGYGVVTAYGHNAQNLVKVGQVVKRAEPLATVGQSGRSTGPHVHYEIWVNGRAVNPVRFIQSADDLTLAH
jgi:hypothetical protein